MDFAALFALFQSWGPTAISSLLVIVVLFLLKKVDKNGEEDKKRADGVRKSFEDKLKELKDDTAKELDGHERRLSYIELEYIKREEFYRELGGWRDDINRLSGQITTQFMEFTKSIIEIWKDKKES
jgi:hypothetical protein